MSLAGELFDCVIQYAQFGLFQYVPDSLATVDTVVASLVAVLAKGYTGVLEPLLDVVGIRGFRSSTNPAGQGFDRRQVPSLGGGELIVHAASIFSNRFWYTRNGVHACNQAGTQTSCPNTWPLSPSIPCSLSP